MDSLLGNSLIMEPFLIESTNTKDFFKNKKYTWANKLDINKVIVWGERYGYDLAEPFVVYDSGNKISEDEDIDKHLTDKNITIPNSLYAYLTIVSRELFVGSYPMIFSLNSLPNKFQIDDAMNIIWPEENYGFYEFDESDDNYNNYQMFRNVLVQIGENGCVFDDMIYLGNDDKFGTIWHCMGEGYWKLIHNNFENYIESCVNYIKPKPWTSNVRLLTTINKLWKGNIDNTDKKDIIHL
jgi:hypothetical protein